MKLREAKRAVLSGAWVVEPTGKVEARTKFQKKRLTEAVSAARLYLKGPIRLEMMGISLGVTAERAAQIVRLGVNYMMQAGWLRPADARKTGCKPV